MCERRRWQLVECRELTRRVCARQMCFVYMYGNIARPRLIKRKIIIIMMFSLSLPMCVYACFFICLRAHNTHKRTHTAKSLNSHAEITLIANININANNGTKFKIFLPCCHYGAAHCIPISHSWHKCMHTLAYTHIAHVQRTLKRQTVRNYCCCCCSCGLPC